MSGYFERLSQGGLTDGDCIVVCEVGVGCDVEGGIASVDVRIVNFEGP